jgi:hypothetical protein
MSNIHSYVEAFSSILGHITVWIRKALWYSSPCVCSLLDQVEKGDLRWGLPTVKWDNEEIRHLWPRDADSGMCL